MYTLTCSLPYMMAYNFEKNAGWANLLTKKMSTGFKGLKSSMGQDLYHAGTGGEALGKRYSNIRNEKDFELHPGFQPNTIAAQPIGPQPNIARNTGNAPVGSFNKKNSAGTEFAAIPQ